MQQTNHIPQHHFIVLVHGLDGETQDFTSFKENLTKCWESQVSKLESKHHLHILVSKYNEKRKTRDGIDMVALRLRAEIDRFFHRQILMPHRSTVSVQHKVKFSLMGYSLGGLIIRGAVGILFHEPSEVLNYEIKQYLQPTSFMTICSPHLGVRRASNVTQLMFDIYLNNMTGKTGKQLNLNDKPIHKLVQLSDPNSNSFRAIKLFPYKTLFAPSNNDVLVPLESALLIETNNYPVPVSNVPNMFVVGYSNFAAEYHDLFKPYENSSVEYQKLMKEPQRSSDHVSPYFYNQFQHTNTTKIMLHNLQQLNWRKIVVEICVPSKMAVLSARVHMIPLNTAYLNNNKFKNNQASLKCMALISSILSKDHLQVRELISPNQSK